MGERETTNNTAVSSTVIRSAPNFFEKVEERGEKKVGRRTNLLEDLVDVGGVGLDSLLVPLLLVTLSLGGLGGGGLLSGSLGSRGLGGSCREEKGRREGESGWVLRVEARSKRWEGGGRKETKRRRWTLTSLLSGSLGGGGRSGLRGHVESEVVCKGVKGRREEFELKEVVRGKEGEEWNAS